MNKILRLEDVVANDSKNLSVEVNKPIDIEIDLGNLLAVDPNPLPKELNASSSTSEEEKCSILQSITRDCTQAIVNKLWKCETEVDYDTVIARLPQPTEPIPREKPIPQARQPTKWESFAKLKGIEKRKKSNKVWDPESKNWKFTWGYRKKRGEKDEKDYAANLKMEMDREQNENRQKTRVEDQPSTKKHLNKSERIAKNELNRLRNIAKSKKGSETGGILPTASMSKKYIPLKSESRKALDVATTSTASLGRFTERLKNDKREKSAPQKLMIKDKHESRAFDVNQEKDIFMKVFKNVQKKKSKVDTESAAKVFKGRAKDEVEEELGKTKMSKTMKKRREGAKAHASRVSFAQLRKGHKRKSLTRGGSSGGGGGGGGVTKKKLNSGKGSGSKKKKGGDAN